MVLLCLELMLTSATFALIAFSRMWGNSNGQILAIIVMTVAACEVGIRLQIIVAISPSATADEILSGLRELQGSCLATHASGPGPVRPPSLMWGAAVRSLRPSPAWAPRGQDGRALGGAGVATTFGWLVF